MVQVFLDIKYTIKIGQDFLKIQYIVGCKDHYMEYMVRKNGLVVRCMDGL